MVFQHNNKVISINRILIHDLYVKTANRVYNTKDDSCGYFQLLEKVLKIAYRKPILAQNILFLINDALNDTSSFVQDKNSTNRIIIEAIKTDNLRLLNKDVFDPNRLPTYAIKGLFGTLDQYGSKMLNKLCKGEMYGTYAVFFENCIRWVAKYMDKYLIDLDVLDDNYNLSFWRMICITDDIPNDFDIFYGCNSGSWLYGFQLFYNIWHVSKELNQPTFDILFRFVIIELYIKSRSFIAPGNISATLTKGPKFTMERKLIKDGTPDITVCPAYVSTLNHVRGLNHRIYKFGNQICKEHNIE